MGHPVCFFWKFQFNIPSLSLFSLLLLFKRFHPQCSYKIVLLNIACYWNAVRKITWKAQLLAEPIVRSEGRRKRKRGAARKRRNSKAYCANMLAQCIDTFITDVAHSTIICFPDTNILSSLPSFLNFLKLLTTFANIFCVFFFMLAQFDKVAYISPNIEALKIIFN